VRTAEARSCRLLRLAVPLFALALLFAASLLYEKVRSKGAAPRFRGLPCLLESNEVQLPIRLRPLRGVITEGDRAAVPGPPTLWHFEQVSGMFRLTRVLAKKRVRVSAFVLGRAPTRSTAVDTARWGRSTPPAVFFLHQRRRVIEVTVEGIGQGARARIVGLAPNGEQPSYVHRDLALARLTGKRPDLFVIDRNNRSGAVTLSVYSGESRFRRALVRGRRLPLTGLDPAHWVLDVGRDTSARADILFVRRGGS
jgi:hypothetical protein